MEAVKRDFIVVETLGAHGRVQARDRVPLSGEKGNVTIGRSVEADVMLDDPHVAALHASVEVGPEGTVLASDLGSVNGITVAGRRHRNARGLALPDGLLQVGRTRLRVRLASETLPPEKPDHAAIDADREAPSWAAAAGAAFFVAYAAYLAWLDAPRDVAAATVATAFPMLLVAAFWIAFWALLSRVMQGEWRWRWHAAILFCIVAVLAIGANLLDLAWFVYSLPGWPSRDTLVGASAIAVALYWHLTYASSLSRRRAVLIAVLLPAALTGTWLWVQGRVQDRDVNYIPVSEKIYPPALRVRKAADLQSYFDRATALQAAADAKRKKIPVDDVGDSLAGDDQE